MIIVFYSIYISIKPPVVTEYSLSELDDGVYVLYQQVVSNIPADNYEVATFSGNNGNVFTIKGNVNISYSEDEPKAILKSRDCVVYGDDITFYVPQGTVSYLGISGSGR